MLLEDFCSIYDRFTWDKRSPFVEKKKKNDRNHRYLSVFSMYAWLSHKKFHAAHFNQTVCHMTITCMQAIPVLGTQ